MALKYENVAEVGQVIRSYDFEPFGDERDNCYIEGRVIAKGSTGFGFAGYTVKVLRDVWKGVELDGLNERNRTGTEVCVPFESMLDWENRVILVE